MSDTPAQKISDVEVRNYMRVRRARLTLDGNTFVISGDNEQGKSSFVQAIEDAFGGSKFSPAMPIRKGAAEAVILITLTDGSGRTLKAEIVHSKTGRRLVVKDADGKTQSSPQAIMDAFWAETSFDPSLFLISKPDKQVEMLKKLGGLDFAALDKERLEKFTLRTGINREAERITAVASAMPAHPSAPAEEVSARTILGAISEANTHNSKRAPLVEAATDFKESIASYQQESKLLLADADEITEEIKRLETKRAAKVARMAKCAELITHLSSDLATAIKELEAFQTVDVAPLQKQLADVEVSNQQVRANKAKAEATKRGRDKHGEADLLTRRIEEIDEEKAEKLAGAKFPIEGMSVTDTDVTIGGIPLAQQSDMRRLAIGVEMAAVMNPGKPLMLVRHGNLFTPQNFHVLEEIAAKRNLTCIVEIPGKNVAGSKLVFEDGVGVVPGEQSGEQAELPAS